METIKRVAGGVTNATDYHFEVNRKKSFQNWPKKDTVSVKSLAASGFVFIGESDILDASCVNTMVYT